MYLCGQNSPRVEAFSPQTDSFLSLQLQLPEVSDCCLYVHSNLLVVHSFSFISKFAAGQRGQLIARSQVPSQTSVFKNSNSLPVVNSSQGLFYIFQVSKVLILSMETGEEVGSLLNLNLD